MTNPLSEPRQLPKTWRLPACHSEGESALDKFGSSKVARLLSATAWSSHNCATFLSSRGCIVATFVSEGLGLRLFEGDGLASNRVKLDGGLRLGVKLRLAMVDFCIRSNKLADEELGDGKEEQLANARSERGELAKTWRLALRRTEGDDSLEYWGSSNIACS